MKVVSEAKKPEDLKEKSDDLSKDEPANVENSKKEKAKAAKKPSKGTVKAMTNAVMADAVAATVT